MVRQSGAHGNAVFTHLPEAGRCGLCRMIVACGQILCSRASEQVAEDRRGNQHSFRFLSWDGKQDSVYQMRAVAIVNDKLPSTRVKVHRLAAVNIDELATPKTAGVNHIPGCNSNTVLAHQSFDRCIQVHGIYDLQAQRQIRTVSNCDFGKCDTRDKRIYNTFTRNGQRTQYGRRNICLQSPRFVGRKKFYVVDAVCQGLFAQRWQLCQLHFVQGKHRRGHLLKRNLQVFCQLWPLPGCTRDQLRFQRSGNCIESCVNDRAVAFAGAFAHVECPVDHDHSQLILGQLISNRATNNTRTNNCHVVRLLVSKRRR